MAVHLGRRTADASAAQVAGLPDDPAGRGCPELCRVRVRGCRRLASADALELRVALQARRVLTQMDALPKAAIPFLGQAVAVVLQAVVVVVQAARMETECPSVRQA
jgi:hypothetical protein